MQLVTHSAPVWTTLLSSPRRMFTRHGSKHPHDPPPPRQPVSHSAPVPLSPATPLAPSSYDAGDDKMVVDALQMRGPISDAEKQRRLDNNLCLYCGKPGHSANACPNKRRNKSEKSTLRRSGNGKSQS
ncbi:hypothetical protein BCR44DRAFT_350387 [Catenaria anguillulae PL171]|uniref:CCHC-type domain-containing protein n=1 Tax=Catenaria anguillulae PL171 TaxID=765915 RepID=A0A1Y2HGS1_9FUNG|nr:hypothetical protein BCR44DRAFT_350387 [Catenaria anguillulae PL171]